MVWWFTTEWRGWAGRRGRIVRNQAHGSPASILDLYAASDIPETEGVGPYRIKWASSAANVTANGTPITFGTNSLNNTNADGGSAFLVKYDSAGQAQWAKSFNSAYESYFTSVTLDGSGTALVTSLSAS